MFYNYNRFTIITGLQIRSVYKFGLIVNQKNLKKSLTLRASASASNFTGSSTIDASNTLSAMPSDVFFHHPPSSSTYRIRHSSDYTPSSTPARYLLWMASSQRQGLSLRMTGEDGWICEAMVVVTRGCTIVFFSLSCIESTLQTKQIKLDSN